MIYAMVTQDYGQGAGCTLMPVSKNTGLHKAETTKPYSAVEVLTKFFSEDFMLVVSNFVQMEPEKIRESGVLRNADNIRLLKCTYLKTESRLHQPIQATVVDFIVEGRLTGQTENGDTEYANRRFRVRYILDLRPCEQKCMGPLIFVDGQWEDDPVFPRYMIQTDEYLIPILKNEEYEMVAQEMIEHYYSRREMENPSFRMSGYDLAQRMGLRVIEGWLDDPGIMGQLYYDTAYVTMTGRDGRSFLLRVKPGTIVVNLGVCTTEAAKNTTILHECSHMYLDRWFFFLQMMTGNSYAAYTNRRKVQPRIIRNNTAVDWMELQCEKLPAYLLMPRDNTIAFIENELAEMGGERTPYNIRAIITKLSAHYNVSKAMAKYRLIELGYYEAEGVLCYIENRAIPDHGCDIAWPQNTTFTISPTDTVMLMEKSKHFEDTIRTGKYRYVESHFCLRDPRYLELDSRGDIRLSMYARTHINECCLSFSVSGRYKEVSYQSGTAARSKTQPVTNKYLTRYEFQAEPGEQKYDLENAAFAEDSFLWGELSYEISEDFGMAILEIMKRKGRTQESLALELGVDRRALYKYLHQSSPSLEHMVGICIALSLPYNIAFDLIDAAGGRFRRTELHHLYKRFLIMSEQLTVSRCNDILALKKYAPLFQGAD